jgi:hypothetical protein
MEGKISYVTPNIGTARTAVGRINLCRDLSLINRKNHEQTTRKGVPLVYHCKVTTYKDAFSSDADRQDEMQFFTVPQNWVFRNASVQLHKAREAMYKKNGVRKSERGRYSKTIRYLWDQTESFLAPYNMHELTSGAPTQYAGAELGTWDCSDLIMSDGDTVNVSLWTDTTLQDQDAALPAGVVGLTQGYLYSRAVITDDDDGSEALPAKFSMIKDLFNTTTGAESSKVRDLADTEQDSPPYDADDLEGTFTQPVLQGRTLTGQQAAYRDVAYIDVPFGMIDVFATSINGSADQTWDFDIEVLSVSEMQG